VVNARSIVGDSEGRPEHDFYRTPAKAVRALLSAESFPGITWEPACGDGAISSVLIENGLDVISSDLLDYGYAPTTDFLTSDLMVDNIITNPPFRHAQAFVERALGSTTSKVAMLLKLAFLEGKRRKDFFFHTPLKTVYVFSERLKLSRNGDDEAYKNGGMIAFAWFVWEHGYNEEPVVRWL
jgi:hypothetical protein